MYPFFPLLIRNCFAIMPFIKYLTWHTVRVFQAVSRRVRPQVPHECLWGTRLPSSESGLFDADREAITDAYDGRDGVRGRA